MALSGWGSLTGSPAVLYARPLSIRRIVVFALRELEARLGEKCWRLMTPKAVRGLATQLGLRIDFLFRPVIRIIERGRLVSGSAGGLSSSYGRGIRSGQAAALLMSFPALAETLTLVVWDWVEAQRELLSRLNKDAALVRKIVGSGPGLDEVTDVRLDVSDPHDGGRSVAMLRFVSGKRAVYKPRPCVGELLWARSLIVFNEEGFDMKFLIPRTCDRSRYHWMAFVRQVKCRDKAAVRRFYYRWGAQAAIAALFRFADLHCENWIAFAEHPVLVDAEVFGWTVLPKILGADLEPLTASGLLPFAPSHGLPYHGIAPFDLPTRFKQPPAAWPKCGNGIEAPISYAREITAGFAALMDFLARNERARDRIQRLFSKAQGYTRRILFRSTMAYQQLLQRSLDPNEILLSPTRLINLRLKCLTSAGSPAVAEAEALALLRCNVPRFALKGRRSSGARWRYAGAKRRKQLLITLRAYVGAAPKRCHTIS
jgi:Domain of unknown function (DUF4135)